MTNMVMTAACIPSVPWEGVDSVLLRKVRVEGKAFVETFLSAACLSVIRNYCC